MTAGFSLSTSLVTPRIGDTVDRTSVIRFPVDFVLTTYDIAVSYVVNSVTIPMMVEA